MVEMKTIDAPAAAHAIRDEITALLRRHAGTLSPEMLLAVASQIVGQIIANLDEARISKAEVWAVIKANIERGNADMARVLLGMRGPMQ